MGMGLMGLAQFGLPILGSFWQTMQANQANAKNEADQQGALNYVDENDPRLMEQYQNLFNLTLGSLPGMRDQMLQGYANRERGILGNVDAGINGLNNFMRGRIGDTMGFLDQFGNSAKRDLNRSFDNADSRIMQDAISSGLQSTTVLPSMRIGLERQRGDALNTLNEQISTQKAGAYERLSGDLGNAMQGGLNLWTNTAMNTSGDYLGAMDAMNTRQLSTAGSMGLAGIDLNRALQDRRLGIMQGYPAQGPPPGNPFDAAASGLNSLRAYQASQQQPSSSSWFGPAAVNAGSSFLAPFAWAGAGAFG